MRKSLIIFAISVAGFFIIPGCTKSSNPTASMSATINDSAFSALGSRVSATGKPNSAATITATNLPVAANSIATSIGIDVFDSVGDYTISPTGTSTVTAYLISAATGGLPVMATSGNVRITNSSAHYFQGSFTLNFASNSVVYTVTNGQFTGTY